MNKKLFFAFTLLLSGLLLSTSCKKEEEVPQEFVANNQTFTGFKSFTKVAENNGPDPSLGAAHSGNDSTVTRYIYFKDNVAASGGTYPVGAVIVKESKNDEGTVNMITAMVKRGNSFNTQGGDWEWFVLTSDGTIAKDEQGNDMRGVALMNGACVSCHAGAEVDYVFSK